MLRKKEYSGYQNRKSNHGKTEVSGEPTVDFIPTGIGLPVRI